MEIKKLNARRWRKKMAEEDGGRRDLRVSINFYKKQCLPVITWNKKHLLKQALTITYTLKRKKFFAVPTFECLEVVSF